MPSSETPNLNRRITRRMAKIKALGQEQRISEEKCSICLHEIEKNHRVTLPCRHQFCIQCIAEWWEYNCTCPYCRKYFSCVFDHKNKQLTQDFVIKEFGKIKEKTLVCELCWADIGNETMRICFDCRSVYVHRRCLPVAGWKSKYFCEECDEAYDRQMEKETEQKMKDQAFEIRLKCADLPEDSERRMTRQTLQM